ncbi:YheC/YheD family protein [Bacillus sp. SCS-153A]|uniref:YheC/YheD family endospore coat-associated protein n=1 Tax=Rossellomorea sedimentorum TaxID=3115294 RepID=UPI003906647D
MLFNCKVSKSNEKQPTLLIPARSPQGLRTFAGKAVSSRFGLTQFDTKIAAEVTDRDDCELLFPANHPFQLSGSCNLTAHFSEENRLLSLGPVIAVLTDTDSSGKPTIGRLGQYFDELHRYTRLQGGLFFLTGPSLLRQQQGYLFNEEKGEWLQSSVPLPNILYNRVHSRRSDRSQAVKSLITELEEQSVFVFNSSYLTKDYVYELLSQEENLLEYLPHTEPFSLSGLRRLIEHHQDLFIKHIAGSQGKKLLRLEYLENEYRLVQNIGDETVQKFFPSLKETYEELANLKVSSHFIIQETINLLKFSERALDFRFLCHLVDRQEWKLVSAVARISGDGQFVSNIAQGGELAKPLTILCAFFSPEKALTTYQLMEELALSACCRLADNCPLTLGELGVDLGVDEEGKPWLIEVNSKPSKQTYTDTDTIRPSVKSLYILSKTIWEERRASYDQTGNHDAGT